ncbi:hypothetical protein GWK47_011009 [Chionoecetes opilio]|uniref:Uncharacterized protein n=1 Tax=Chionoecetes opilio TaxID=41210 RepID=A0A8J4XY57_CHIOP|nr:hypothetical protein GWK47_011009 [Chionoecetes opilio]
MKPRVCFILTRIIRSSTGVTSTTDGCSLLEMPIATPRTRCCASIADAVTRGRQSASHSLLHTFIVAVAVENGEVFVFAWDGDTLLGTTAKVKLIHRCFIAGGINSFANHTQDLSDYFSPCLGEVKALCPPPSAPAPPSTWGPPPA